MRLLEINSVCGVKSTGRIATQIAEEYENKGYKVKIAYGRENVPDEYKKYAVKIGNQLDVYWHVFVTRLFDAHGFASKRATKRFLKWANKYNPDILWLHNIHGYYINVEMLFEWIKSRPDMKVKWTLHDCWAFTGHCAFFNMFGCCEWKNSCEICKHAGEYPQSFISRDSSKNYIRKRKAFSAVYDMQIVVPSEWLKSIARETYLSQYDICVKKNAIDLTIFKYVESTFRIDNELEDKTIILGVASVWNERKGIADFVKIRSLLSDEYVIILVGVTPKQKRKLPSGIIGILSVSDKSELAKIYSSADWFINPTYDDNFPTVNLEAEACGTRVITYDTGGCKETISKIDSHVVSVGDYKQIVEIIRNERK